MNNNNSNNNNNNNNNNKQTDKMITGNEDLTNVHHQQYQKLKINTAAAIYDIIMCIVMLFSWVAVWSLSYSMMYVSYIAAIVLLGLHIYALVVSNKHYIKKTGNILGIIGSALWLCIGVFATIPSLVLFIIASVFLFKQAENTK